MFGESKAVKFGWLLPLNITLIKPMQKYPNINESKVSIL